MLEELLVVVEVVVRADCKVFEAGAEFQLHHGVLCRSVIEHGADAQEMIAAQWT